MDQRLTSSKSDIIDVYREESRPENLTLWHPHRDCQRSGQQALRFDTLSSIRDVVGEPGEAIIWETKAADSADKNGVIDRVKSLGQADEVGCTVFYQWRLWYCLGPWAWLRCTHVQDWAGEHRGRWLKVVMPLSFYPCWTSNNMVLQCVDTNVVHSAIAHYSVLVCVVYVFVYTDCYRWGWTLK